jgi:hypothetical protein
LLLLLAALAGCSSSRQKAQVEQPVETPAPGAAAVAPPAAAAPAPATAKLYGTLSADEFESCYRLPEATNLFRPAQTTAPSAPGPASAAAAYSSFVGAGWDVRITQPWKYIVIHHSATRTGSAASFDREHRERGWEGLGYHFVIGNGTGSGNGEVEVGYRWRRQCRGAHAGNLDYNERGIGICLVGDFETGYPTAAQMTGLYALVRFLQARCGIALANIIGHDDVPGKQTRCPGKNFSVAAFRAGLQGEFASRQSAPAVAPRAAPLSANRAVPVRRTAARPGGAGCP